jgi:hypothetical protein
MRARAHPEDGHTQNQLYICSMCVYHLFNRISRNVRASCA